MATSLQPAYAPFAASLRAGEFREPAAGEWSPSLIAAHIICNNDLIADVAEAIARGEDVDYDNESGVNDADLERFAATVGGLSDLAAEVQRSAARLDAAYQSLGSRADAALHVRIRDGQEIAVDRPGTIGALVEGNASFHLDAHHEQLKALQRPWVADPPAEFDSYQLILLVRGSNPPVLDEAASTALQREHLGHLQKMRAAGLMGAAGPVSGDPEIAGICIYTASSVDEARALAEDDPAVKAGRLEVKAREWFTGKGAFGVRRNAG
jgi:uncharacterized protein YciI